MADVNAIAVWIVKIEDDPRHPGISKDLYDGAGLTRYGFTRRWHSQDLPAEFWTTMPNDEAYPIACAAYARLYCVPLHVADIESDDIASALISFAVNDNAKVAVKTLQTALFGPGPQVDGKFGPGTLAELNSKDPVAVAAQFRAEWEDFYRRDVQFNPVKAQFLNGWLNRVKSKQ